MLLCSDPRIHKAPVNGVQIKDDGRITIRAQKRRWGSCVGKGNLNFNRLLMLCPEVGKVFHRLP